MSGPGQGGAENEKEAAASAVAALRAEAKKAEEEAKEAKQKKEMEKEKKKFAFPDLSLFAYRIFGRFTDRTKLVKDEELRKCLMRTTAARYVSKMYLLTMIGAVVTVAVTLPFLVRWMILSYAVFSSLALGLLVGAAIFLATYMYPTYAAGMRKRKINTSLNFATQYMAILAGADVTPERIFKSLVKGDVDKIIKEEVGEIVKAIDLFGKDFYTAIQERIKDTASPKFADLLKGILAVGNMGGDLRRYLYMQGRAFMRERRIDMKKQLDGLGVAAEIYISMGVVLPLIIVVMLATMSFIGGSGINAVLWMYVVTFVMIPAVSALMLLILDSSVPREE
ncbi:MAG: type II secretion system F family protein [Candidatus Methanosuratus sp.]|nr:type II secretion system F family protein [Candidatus Methanosuratincola sp.]